MAEPHGIQEDREEKSESRGLTARIAKLKTNFRNMRAQVVEYWLPFTVIFFIAIFMLSIPVILIIWPLSGIELICGFSGMDLLCGWTIELWQAENWTWVHYVISLGIVGVLFLFSAFIWAKAEFGEAFSAAMMIGLIFALLISPAIFAYTEFYSSYGFWWTVAIAAAIYVVAPILILFFLHFLSQWE